MNNSDTDKYVNQHPISILMGFIAIIVLGIVCFLEIPVSLFPNLIFPGLTIETEYHGVGPDKIEEIITKPIEESISAIGGIKQIFSTSEEGKSKIHIQFDSGVNIETKGLDVRDKLEQAISRFPREVQKPVVLQYDPSQRPFFILTLTSNKLSLTDQRDIADREIKKLIEGVPGITEVIVAGGSPREILIACDKGILDSLNLSFNQILNALQENNLNEAIGVVHENSIRVPVYVKGRLSNIDKIRNLIIATDGKSNKQVHLREIADVDYSFREIDSASRFNGQEVVSIYIYRAGTTNLIEISKKIILAIREMETDQLDIKVTFNQAEIVTEAFQSIIICTIIGIVFLFLSEVIIFRSFVQAMCTSLAIISSFLLTMVALYFAKLDLNLMTLSGYLQSISLVIIFVHYIRFFQAQNKSVTLELIVILLIIAGVFLPIIFSSNEYKIIYGGFAVVILISTLSSLLISLTLLPLVNIHIENRKLYLPSLDRLELSVSRKYEFFLNLFHSFFLERKRVAILYLIIFVVGLFSYFSLGQDYMPPIEEKQITGTIEFPSGTSFNSVNLVSKRVESKIASQDYVKEVSTRIDLGQATLTIKFKDKFINLEEGGKKLEELIGDIKPAFVYFSGSNDEALLKEVTIDVLGDNLETLTNITKELANKVEDKVSNVKQVLLRFKPPREEYQIIINKSRSELLGVNSDMVGRLMRFGIQGGVATKFIENDRELDVKIQYAKPFRNEISEIPNFRVKSDQGRSIPLSEIAYFERANTPVKIYRKNKRRVLSFSIRLVETNVNKLTNQLEEVKKFELPENYRIEFSEQFEELLRNQTRTNRLLFFSIIILYMILASFTESLLQPFVLLGILPIPISVFFIIASIFNIKLTIPVYISLFLSSSISILQVFLLQKEILDQNNVLTTGDRTFRTFSLYFKQFLLIWFIIFIFYLPFLFTFGSGSNLLREMSFTFIATGTISLFFLPIAFQIMQKADLENFLKKWFFLMKSGIIYIRRNNK